MRDMLKKNNGKPVSCFDVSERVTEEHFKNHVGLVPLSKTLHDMAHNKAIIIPISSVNGNYKKFIEKYKESIPEEMLTRIKTLESYTDSEESAEFNSNKLKKRIVNYEITYNDNSDNENN